MFSIDLSSLAQRNSIPARVQTAVGILVHLGNIESPTAPEGQQRDGRELIKEEQQLQRAACETVRLYIAGDLNLDPAGPDPRAAGDGPREECNCPSCRSKRAFIETTRTILESEERKVSTELLDALGNALSLISDIRRGMGDRVLLPDQWDRLTRLQQLQQRHLSRAVVEAASNASLRAVLGIPTTDNEQRTTDPSPAAPSPAGEANRPVGP